MGCQDFENRRCRYAFKGGCRHGGVGVAHRRRLQGSTGWPASIRLTCFPSCVRVILLKLSRVAPHLFMEIADNVRIYVLC
jgi:hypothetical protein